MSTVRRFPKVLRRGLLVVLGLLGGAAAVLVVVGQTARGPGDDTVPAGYTRNESFCLTMRDGTKIAVDVWYPADLKRGQKVPTLLYSTRYGRALEPGFGRRVATGLGLSEDIINLDKYLSDEIGGACGALRAHPRTIELHSVSGVERGWDSAL